MLRSTALSLLLLSAAATGANAQGLRGETDINAGLKATATAVELSDNCPGVNARLLRGINYLRQLEQMAKDRGYSQSEIDAYVDSRKDKKRLEAEARAELSAKGAVEGDRESYCKVARAEMAEGSAIGRLLR
ncbi:DUF5333 domain-containing protein [Roseicyclus sp. F158]|uniref:DUF5333 domain-containing protein n=1 Tax=Tropicimonas omnivorans TaxID=3075590 RepID=A0ABU3DKP1_9RHOB|nr:DUF5333 domain-containing protein [Roseicyclus sp. F158]MDT0683682.1 DUF5333 domain-containing protein [Roseicyclus sp. F158]